MVLDQPGALLVDWLRRGARLVRQRFLRTKFPEVVAEKLLDLWAARKALREGTHKTATKGTGLAGL